jgi:hypothetical protein
MAGESAGLGKNKGRHLRKLFLLGPGCTVIKTSKLPHYRGALDFRERLCLLVEGFSLFEAYWQGLL